MKIDFLSKRFARVDKLPPQRVQSRKHPVLVGYQSAEKWTCFQDPSSRPRNLPVSYYYSFFIAVHCKLFTIFPTKKKKKENFWRLELRARSISTGEQWILSSMKWNVRLALPSTGQLSTFTIYCWKRIATLDLSDLIITNSCWLTPSSLPRRKGTVARLTSFFIVPVELTLGKNNFNPQPHSND